MKAHNIIPTNQSLQDDAKSILSISEVSSKKTVEESHTVSSKWKLFSAAQVKNRQKTGSILHCNNCIHLQGFWYQQGEIVEKTTFR